MSVTSPDFESGAYTNFATPALQGKDDKASCGGIATEDRGRLTDVVRPI